MSGSIVDKTSTRFAVAVPRITSNARDNLNKVLSMMDEASVSKADLLLFPEAVLTGLNLSDHYERDRELAISIGSSQIQAIIRSAATHRLWTAFGFLELLGATIFDSALLVDAYGRIVLHQRRMSPGWRAKNASPLEYGSGAGLSTALTPWGKTAILICGDLFEVAFHLAAEAKLDLLLLPFARCFPRKVREPQRQWNDVEWPDYSVQIKQIRALALMSNYIASRDLSGGGFGGGFIVDPHGKLIKAMPLFEEGLLVWDQTTG